MPQPSTVELPNLGMGPRMVATRHAGLSDARLPGRGTTILAVEDSRFACEALRLMCQRSGARLRRAETLAAARAHLRLYRPDVVIVDLGLPDGRGDVLIRDLVLTAPRPLVILGSSGLASGRATALAAGADGFLDKPVDSLATFQRAVFGTAEVGSRIDIAGGAVAGPGLACAEEGPVQIPDTLALRDDLVLAAEGLASMPDAGTRRYLAGFVQGLARMARDPGLAAAAERCAAPDAGVESLQQVIAARLAQASAGFGQ